MDTCKGSQQFPSLRVCVSPLKSLAQASGCLCASLSLRVSFAIRAESGMDSLTLQK